MSQRLYVGNLSFDTTEENLRKAFERDGRTVREVQVVTKSDTGRSRGFGFVDMASEEEARSAMEAMDGSDLDGRAIRVGEAKQETTFRSTSGWYGGGIRSAAPTTGPSGSRSGKRGRGRR